MSTTIACIWKYPLAVDGVCRLPMPTGATVLAVGVQDNRPVLWAVVDPTRQYEDRTFYIVGTGHPMGDAEGCQHVGTFLLNDGAFVGHLFAERSISGDMET